jgi:hypothetical protein
MSLFGRMASPRRNVTHGSQRGQLRRRMRFAPSLDGLEIRALLSTILVTNTSDSGSGSLRQAIIDAPSGSTIAFANSLRGQTITLTSGDLAINQSLNINGPGASELAVSGGGSSQVFAVAAGTDVTISGLSITDGFSCAGLGGGIVNAGNLTLKNADVFGNVAESDAAEGGGIANTGTLTLQNTQVTGNQAISEISDAEGGGIENATGATLLAIQSVIANNQALIVPPAGTQAIGGLAQGGGINSDIAGSVTLRDCTVSGNSALGGSVPYDAVLQYSAGWAFAGAIYSTGTLNITGSTIDNNLAQGGDSPSVGGISAGGAIVLATSTSNGLTVASTLNMTDTTLDNNQSVGGTTSATAAVSFAGTATGGAISSAEGSSIEIAGSSFEDNQALGGGGGQGSATGGAIASGDSILFTISNSTFVGNQAVGGNGSNVPAFIVAGGGDASGGAISSFQDPLIITSSVFKGNQALGGTAFLAGFAFGAAGTGGGGALDYGTDTSSVTASISGSSFSDNLASGGTSVGGGDGYAYGGAMTVDGSPLGGASALSISQTSIVNNIAQAGPDATSIDAAAGAQGGGIYNQSSISISASTLAGNQAIGANSSSSGAGGPGQGGALYNYEGNATISSTLITANQAEGGAGIAATQGLGQPGGPAQGGGIFSQAGNVTLDHTQLGGNSAIGGAGGSGAAGGTGAGGALFASNTLVFSFTNGQFIETSVPATMTVTNSSLSGNLAQGGCGSTGGDAQGGGVVSFASDVSLSNTSLTGNSAIGAAGASGTAGGAGGAGGFAEGGGLYSSGTSMFSFVNNEIVITPLDSTVTATNSPFIGNVAQGGAGGAGNGAGTGGAGGSGAGGGAYNDVESSLGISGSLLSLNAAIGGNGGAGGSTGAGGDGGDGFGGGVFNTGPGTEYGATLPAGPLDLTDDLVLGNLAIGGSGGRGAPKGSAGQGQGGGLYLATGSTSTLRGTPVLLNFASTSDPDIFGTPS